MAIRSHPANENYRQNFDLTFGKIRLVTPEEWIGTVHSPGEVSCTNSDRDTCPCHGRCVCHYRAVENDQLI